MNTRVLLSSIFFIADSVVRGNFSTEYSSRRGRGCPLQCSQRHISKLSRVAVTGHAQRDSCSSGRHWVGKAEALAFNECMEPEAMSKRTVCAERTTRDAMLNAACRSRKAVMPRRGIGVDVQGRSVPYHQAPAGRT